MANLPNQMPQLNIPFANDIPVIDLSIALGSEVDRSKLIEQMNKALDQYRGFQVIKHGVSNMVMEDAIDVYKEIFNLPGEEMDGITDTKKPWVYIGSDNVIDVNNFLNDTIRHDCYPLQQTIDSWPQKPDRYRKVISEYATETKKVCQKILDLIGEGLGIEKGYFDGELSHEQILQVKYYPKCPDPSSMDGCWEHYDPNLITLIQANVAGLLIRKDGKWVAIPSLPNAFFVLTGMQLEIISNGKYKSALHQVVRNAEADRISIAVFFDSLNHTKLEPAKGVLKNGKIRPKYKALTHQELTEKFRKELSMGESAASAGESALASFLL